MRNLLIRSIIAILIIGPLFLAPLWLGGIFLLIFTMLISIGLMWEFKKFADVGISTVHYVIIAAMCLLWEIAVFSNYPEILLTIFGAVLILFLIEVGFYDIPRTMNRLGTSLFLFIYCGILPSSFMLVRRYGTFWAILPIAMVWTVDTFAYWGGSIFGRHKLAPQLSPKKTVEGFFTGFASSFLVALIAAKMQPQYNGTVLWLVAPITGIVGQLGDLFESKIKREFAVKDSGKIFPGHGGVWDRTDSLLWVYPLVWMVLLLKSG